MTSVFVLVGRLRALAVVTALACAASVAADGFEPAPALRRRYGAETLEEAFFAATGRGFDDELDDDEPAANA